MNPFLLFLSLRRKNPSPDTATVNYNDSATTHLNLETSPLSNSQEHQTPEGSEAHRIDDREMGELKLAHDRSFIPCYAAHPGSVALEGERGDFTDISVGPVAGRR
jgi:hypothetical protein